MEFKSRFATYIDKADHSEKMTPEMIKRIVGGKESLYALSKELGCSYSYLRLIKQGKIYKTQVAEALKELNLPSAEIHEQDTKLPSSHIAPTANTPQHSVDISAYENPTHLLALLKENPKYANLSAWASKLDKVEGSGGGYKRRFNSPESYIPKEVKINDKELIDNKLELSLVIAYITDKTFDNFQNTHFVVKGDFEVAIVKGKPSIVQKGKLEMRGTRSNETHEKVFKTDAEKQDISKLDTENYSHNNEMIKHFVSQHKGEVERMVEQVAKNSKYDIKSVETKWSYTEGEFQTVLHLPNGNKVDVFETGSMCVDAKFDNGTSKDTALKYANSSSGDWQTKEVRPKIVSLALDKTKTLESVKNCFGATEIRALSGGHGLVEKANDHSKQALTEAFHHFMSQAHFTAFKINSKEEHGIYKFEVQKNNEHRLDELLSKGDYNKFESTVSAFDLKLKDGKPVFEDARKREVDANTILKELDNFDRLAAKNIAKRTKSLETLKHEVADFKAKLEALVTPVGGRVVELDRAYGVDADVSIHAEIEIPAEKRSYGWVYFRRGTASLKGNLGGSVTYYYRNDEHRDNPKKSSKEAILEMWKDNVQKYKEWLAKN